MTSANRSGSGKPSSRPDRREAVAREMRETQERRRRIRMLLSVAVVIVVLAVFSGLVAVGLSRSGGSNAKTTSASAEVENTLASLPSSAFDAVGSGSSSVDFAALSASDPLSSDGKPKVLYVGAEWCPYCAAERWALVAALDRFGTFDNLGQSTSASADVYPNTPTLSFHGSTYSSKYLSFVGYETESNQAQGGGYAPLDSLSAIDQKIFEEYDAPPYLSSAGSIPFVNFGGEMATQGAAYSPELLEGLAHRQVALAIADPTTDLSKAVLGAANDLTAALCDLTDGKPSSVCESDAAGSGQRSLPN
jgi:hypothetical protein